MTGDIHDSRDCFFDLHTGKRDAVLKELGQVVPLVRAEQGCIEYGPTVDVDTGNDLVGPPRRDRVTLLEKWESLDALKAHLDAQHRHEYRAKVKSLIESAEFHVTESV